MKKRFKRKALANTVVLMLMILITLFSVAIVINVLYPFLKFDIEKIGLVGEDTRNLDFRTSSDAYNKSSEDSEKEDDSLEIFLFVIFFLIFLIALVIVIGYFSIRRIKERQDTIVSISNS